MSITTAYAHIAKKPSRKAIIAGTRIAVSDIAAFHEAGLGPAQIQEHYEQLSLAQIHSALAYYYDHRDEIEAERGQAIEAMKDLRRRHPDRVS